MVTDVSKLRAYLVIIIDGRKTLSAIGDFPSACPNCQTPWQVGESWISNSSLQCGGREAACAACGCNMFEVIDRVPVKSLHNLYFIDRLVPSQKATG